MKALKDKWAVQIDVNNLCEHGCTYCTKHIRHLRKDQIVQLSKEEFEKIVLSVKNFPGAVCLTGGEPLSYPDVEWMCELIQKHIPKKKAGIFTSKKHDKYKEIIDKTFGMVFINYHDKDQRDVCLHQPSMISVGEIVSDKVVQDSLIKNCWCNEMWSPIIGKTGAFFCDCAIGWDVLLDMGGGWPIEPNWWERSYQDQMDKYCHLCGVCVPYPRQRQADYREKITPGLYETFKKHNLRNLEDMEIVTEVLTKEDIGNNLVGWEPWHNRQDKQFEGPAYFNK